MAGTAPQARSRWLFGPAADLLLGCGGAYAVVFAALVVAGGSVMRLAPMGLLPIAILLTSIPHYGATLLRVYERQEDRTRYRFFALWSTLAVYAWMVAGVYDLLLGSLLVTLYLTWSPWHYSGQNYGIAVMFLGRRGVPVTPAAKRWLYASFVLSFLLAAVSLHAAQGGALYAPVSTEATSYRVLRVGLPAALALPLCGALLLGYLISIGVACALLRRGARWRDLAPTLCLAGLQAIWFTLPAVSRQTGVLVGLLPFDPGTAEYAFLWVAMGHSIQYVWITTYYALGSSRAAGPASYYWRTLLAGGAIWGLPLLLFGPDLLGVQSVDAGLGLLVAAAVNLHHFILDGAIWKLREGRIAQILLRPEATPESRQAPYAPRASRNRLTHTFGLGVAALGVVYALTSVIGTLEMEYGVVRALDPPDAARMQTAARRLRWLGRANPDVHYNLGVLARRDGDLELARREFTRSIELGAKAPAWLGLGLVEQTSGRPDAALRAYDAALASDPRNVMALTRSAWLLEQRGDRETARARLKRAVELAPERADLRARLRGLE